MTGDALTHPTDARAAAHALVEAATTAGYAPSIHDTQPWRWRRTGYTLELYIERSRVLDATDPDTRLATLSCGVALHHARVSLAAHGWQTTVARMPGDAGPDHLARLHVEGRVPIQLPAVLHLRTVPWRRTDRYPVTGAPVGAPELEAITASVSAEDTRLHTLSAGQVLTLAGAAHHARRTNADGPAWRADLAYWTGGPAIAARGLGRHDGPDASAAEDTAATFVVLHGRADEPGDWLRAGEALSASWLTATERGVSVLPHSAPIEVLGTHEALRVMLGRSGYPYLVLRLGAIDPAEAGLPHAARLPVDQIIEEC